MKYSRANFAHGLQILPVFRTDQNRKMNKEFPTISIITAFYNEERFLAEAIESVLNQDYENWELILIDDGSSDRSTSIAREYERIYPEKIFYLEHAGHANKGLSASRQLGLNHSRGQLITLLDADDIWTKSKLRDQYKIFEDWPELGMACEASITWRSWDGEGNVDVIKPVGAKQDNLHHPPSLMSELYPLGSGAAPCPSGLMIKKNAIISAGGFDNGFTGSKQLYEDQGFLAKIYSKGESVCFLHEE